MYVAQLLAVLVIVYHQCSCEQCDAERRRPGVCQCSNRKDSCPLRLQDDRMNRDNASGPCVVEAVLQQLEKYDIFDDDYGLMRRIAYVETKDGTEYDKNALCYFRRVGIWGLSNSMLHNMELHLRNFTRLNGTIQKICNYFGVNVTGAVNLQNPLVSGIVARFYLLYKSVLNGTLLPKTFAGQSEFWRTLYRKNFPDHAYFAKRLNATSNICQCVQREKPLVPTDWMNRDGAVGSCLVEAVVDKVDETGIFPPDYSFTRRIAYIETRDGAIRPSSPDGGIIWGVTRSALNDMRVEIKYKRSRRSLREILDWSDLKQTANDVQKKFTVNILNDSLEELDLWNPVISCVTARFYLQYQQNLRRVDFPNTTDLQDKFWSEYYTDSSLSEKNFSKGVIEREGSCQCSDEEAKPCRLSLPQDWMNRDDANGSIVIEAVLDLLNLSKIFPPDHHFMRRIAYVETKNGTEIIVHRDEEIADMRVGIWGLTTNMLNQMTTDTNSNLEDVKNAIYNYFGFNMMDFKNLNFRNALVSGVVARFYLHYLAETSSNLPSTSISQCLPECVDGQADFWKHRYRNSDYFSTQVNFTERVMELEGCKVDADIVFILDTSSSIQQEDMDKIINFTKKFVKNLQIGHKDRRVGMVCFGDNYHEMFNLSNHTTEGELLSAIDNLNKSLSKRRNQANVRTNTAAGIEKAIEIFNNDSRSASTVLRIAILLSDGYSQSFDQTVEAAKILHNIFPPVQVYSIGINYVNKTELIYIAGDEARYAHINDFNETEFENIGDYFLKDICLYTKWETPTTHFNGSIDETEIVRYMAPIPKDGVTITVCSTHGEVGLYVWTSSNGEHKENISFTCFYTFFQNSSICKGLFQPNTNYFEDPHPVRKNHRQLKRESTNLQLEITLEGMASDVEFTVDLVEGDVDTDCVGQRISDDCDSSEPSWTTTTSSSSSEGPSAQPQGRLSKKKTIVVAVTSTSSAIVTICCMIILGVVIGRAIYRRQQHKKLQQREENDEECILLDSDYNDYNEYVEM